MEKTGYYIYPTVPGSIYAFSWNRNKRIIKDVVLSSSKVDRWGTAELSLQTSGVSAIDEYGIEHSILTYKNAQKVKLHGIATGRNLRTGSVSNLAPGKYTKLRFYIDGELSYLMDTKESREISGVDYLDFELDTPLEVESHESPELILRFDFVPFKSKSWFKNMSRLKPIQLPAAKWV